MIRDFLQRRKECDGGKGKDIVMMEQPELSLAPSFSTNFNYATGENNFKFKGKQLQMYNHGSETTTHEDLELQLCDPLPLDWEQCLDLKSGRMYYVNRKTLNKTWTRPKDLDLNLDLNMSAYPDSDDNGGYTSPNPYPNRQNSWSGSHGSSGDSDSDGMVAVVCVNCHLLVMLSKASPYCPNCKFLHSPNIETVKSLETLSLLH
ncbi:WW domain-containing protein [Carex littledalei]|uniref:WW domain-containing protein n=1 Tax=Carex littledalei TaxID=544730 RepID=A0A833RAH2_9POAL|nr:WW domain-containing protein [Carex littledalei]